MRPISELKGLRHHINASYNDRSTEVKRCPKHGKLLRYLERQLPVRHEQMMNINRRLNGYFSYRVGVRTNANIPYGSNESFCKMGRAKAIVFPEPVFAFPTQSLPWVARRSGEDSLISRFKLAFEEWEYARGLNFGWCVDRHLRES